MQISKVQHATCAVNKNIYSKALLLLLGSLALTACGGGSSDDDGAVNPDDSGTSSSRVARVIFDFDNNGIFEGEAQYAYDSNGRIVMESYLYTDDGTPDTDFRTFTIGGGTENVTSSYSYDTNGLLETWVIDQGGDRFTITYTYRNDGVITSADMVFEDNNGAVTGEITNELSYTDTRLDRYTTIIAGQLSDTYDLTYDGAGLLASDLKTSVSGTQSEQTYSWRADGNIDLIENTIPDPAINFTEIVDFIYDANGLLITRQVLANDPSDNYQWDMIYDSTDRIIEKRIDLDSDGSVEAVVQSEWESVSCEPVFLWAQRAEPNFKANPASLYLPGTGYAVIPTCEE